MEGAITAEALRVMIEELKDQRVRCWQFTDSASALSIITGDTASWKTRHLRKRVRFLKWRVMIGDVLMRHLPGVDMVADIGTKTLAIARFHDLKKKLGMSDSPSEKKNDPKVKVFRGGGEEGNRVLKLALVMAMISRTRAQEDEEVDEAYDLTALVLIYTVAIILVTLWCQHHAQQRREGSRKNVGGVQRCKRRRRGGRGASSSIAEQTGLDAAA